jgi:osmoprotectant transport system permease protein
LKVKKGISLIKPVKIDNAALFGTVFGLVSFGCSFLIYKPNRLAMGDHLLIWKAFLPWQWLLLLAGWLVVFINLIFNRYDKGRVLLTGLAGNLILIGLFLVLGRQSYTLMRLSNNPLARISLGPGAWLMTGAAYILIRTVRKRLPGVKLWRFIISGSSVLVLIGLVIGGYFNDLSLLKEYLVRQDRFMVEFGRHLALASLAVFFSVLLGTPLGILLYRSRIFIKPVFLFVNTMQTIPSLALFGILIAPLAILGRRYHFLGMIGIKGVGWAPALIALTLYALLPIVRNTYTALKIIDPAAIEAGTGMGMTRLQLIAKIHLPLAIPVILSGIRTALVMTIGNATVAAMIGAGGLGVFVFQGLGQAAPDLILIGVLPITFMALTADNLMRFVTKLITPKGIAVISE